MCNEFWSNLSLNIIIILKCFIFHHEEYCCFINMLHPSQMRPMPQFYWLLMCFNNIVNHNSYATFFLAIPGCGGLLTAPEGTVSSPNHPDSYDHNLVCEWIIRAPVGERLQLQFGEMQLEISTVCRFDYVEVIYLLTIYLFICIPPRGVFVQRGRESVFPKVTYGISNLQ